MGLGEPYMYVCPEKVCHWQWSQLLSLHQLSKLFELFQVQCTHSQGYKDSADLTACAGFSTLGPS